MAAMRRSFAELIHSKVELAPPLRLVFALLIVVAAVSLAIILKSTYWYFAILLAVPLVLKLSRNDEAIRLHALNDSQSGLSLDATQFYGVLNGWLVRGERKMPHIELAESLLQTDPNTDALPSISDKRSPIGFHCCRLKDIQRIEHDSDKGELAVVTRTGLIKLNIGTGKHRDKLIEQIVDGTWNKESFPSRRFAPNVVALMFFVVPLIVYGACTVATAIGLVQVADLPLVDWGQVQNAHGKARGIFTMCAALSSAFLFLHNNVPALPRCAIGAVMVVAGLMLAYYSCVIKFDKVVWVGDHVDVRL